VINCPTVQYVSTRCAAVDLCRLAFSSSRCRRVKSLR
jgi:hypothetical protein